jgi:P-type Cu+ transporter
LTPTELAAPTSEHEVSLSIGGMTCGACVARIERRLNSLDGVEAQVNLASERARIRMPPGTSPAVLIERIESAGFTAEVVDDLASAPDTTAEAEADRRVRYLGRRLVVAGLLFMPLGDASIAFWIVPSLRFPGWQWILLALAAPILTWAAWPFYKAAVRNARHGIATMDTLVSLGIVAAAAWSIYAMFFRDTSHVARSFRYVLAHQSSGAIYLDVAAGVTTFLLAGRYFEALSKRRSGNALRALSAVGAKEVAVLDDTGAERRRPIATLCRGDRFVVRPGETVATDGEVIFGQSAIDRSTMTGESMPADVTVGDTVLGGTVCVGGRLVVRATRLGADTHLAQMLRLVEDAQNQKANVQRLADRIAGVFVPAVIGVALITLAGWLLAGGTNEQAFSAALSVLIIACPCALGLATPTALMVASGEGARLGIFFKGYQALEESQEIDTVLLDKTGTVTEGATIVEDLSGAEGISAEDLLRWAGSLELASEHLVAKAIVQRAKRDGIELETVTGFEALAGLGARASLGDHELQVGRRELFSDAALWSMPDSLTLRCAKWESQGRTVVLVSRDGLVVGALAVSDKVRSTSLAAVRGLKALGLHCVLVTGDHEAAARTVATSIGVDDVISAALPADKVAAIRQLQHEGHRVAMVGDGVNDGPALACADLGLAVGSGTDVAMESADLIIMRDNLTAVPTAITLARRTYLTIRTNLLWAFGYNVIAIPLAAFGFLNPLIAGAAMALSSGCVVWNSSRLRHFSADVKRKADQGAGPGAVLPAAPYLSTTEVLAPARTVNTDSVS